MASWIARSPAGQRVPMSKAKQQIDIRSPRTDAMQLRQRRVGGIGVFFSQHIEAETLVAEFSRDELQRLDLRRGQTQSAEPISTCAFQLLMIERIESGTDATPDCGCGRRRELLAADDSGKSGKARLALAQRRHACNLQHWSKSRIELDQPLDGLFEVGLRVEMDCH